MLITTAVAAGLMVRNVVRTTTTTTKILRHLVVPNDNGVVRWQQAGGLRPSWGLGPPMASVCSYLPRGVVFAIGYHHNPLLQPSFSRLRLDKLPVLAEGRLWFVVGL